MAGDQLVVPIGVTHISLPLKEYNQGNGRKENKRTKRLGLTQAQKESYVTLCMCRLTLVWTLAKLPQSYWNADSSWLDLLSLVWTLSHADSSLCCPVSTGPRVTLRRLPTSQSLFVSLSDWRPLTTSDHVEISGPKPFVWFRAITDKGIVCLADHLRSVTICCAINIHKRINPIKYYPQNPLPPPLKKKLNY